MNGQEQMARATAMGLLRMDLTKIVEELKQELRTEFINSITAEGQARMIIAHELNMLRQHYIGFRRLSWWGRVKWALFKGYGI